MITSALQRPLDTQDYNTVASVWPRSDRIYIQVADYSPSFLLPIAFLASSQVNTLQFVQDLFQILVCEPGCLRLAESDKIIPDLTAPPLPEEHYHFIPITPHANFHWSYGPDQRTGIWPLSSKDSFDDGDTASESQASSSALLQREMREQLLMRDGQCIVANKPSQFCQAAHLAPKHRLDVYEACLGRDFAPPAFRASYAVMLEETLHTAYAEFKWSFYKKGSNLVVHVFHGIPDLLQFHGKVITPDRFRLFPNEYIEEPEPRLMAWHYQQCVRMYLRGFWAPET